MIDLYKDLGFQLNLEKPGLFSKIPTANQSNFNSGVAVNVIGSGQSTNEVSLVKGYLQSDGFITGIIGWHIDSDGNVEFNDGVFRGTLEANSINIPDAVTANSFHTDNEGNSWWGAATLAAAVAKILKTGVATFTNAFITGGSIGGIGITDITNIGTATADAVPSNLSCSATTAVVASDGSVSSSVVLTWTAISTPTFDHYIIRFKKAANTYYTYLISNTNTITIEGLVPNTSYNFGVASVNKYGTVSTYSTNISQTTATSTTVPATVIADSATAGIQYIILEWTHNTESDLASYNIYRNTTNDSAGATLIGNVRTDYFIDGGRIGGQIYYYWIKAVNTSGLLGTSFSIVKSATPRNVTSDDVVTIAGSKVLIDGAVYLSNWRKTGDLTMIDGGSISANTITTTKLNFTPVQSTDVIAKINASAEGISIDADNLTISAATTFAAGYNPTGKITTFYQTTIPISIAIGDLWIDTDDGNKLYRAEVAGADAVIAGEWVAVPDSNKLEVLGGAYNSATSGARVRIFPDSSTGIQVIDDAGADVFKAMVGGADVGDVIIGDYGNDKGVKWDKSAATFTVKGSLITGIGSTINGTYIDSLSVGKLIAGTINSQSIVLGVAAGTGDVEIRAGIATGDFANAGAAAGFILGLDDSDADKSKFYLGSSTQYLKWDGTDLMIAGKVSSNLSGHIISIDPATNALTFYDGVTYKGKLKMTDDVNSMQIDSADDIYFTVNGVNTIKFTNSSQIRFASDAGEVYWASGRHISANASAINIDGDFYVSGSISCNGSIQTGNEFKSSDGSTGMNQTSFDIVTHVDMSQSKEYYHSFVWKDGLLISISSEKNRDCG